MNKSRYLKVLLLLTYLTGWVIVSLHKIKKNGGTAAHPT